MNDASHPSANQTAKIVADLERQLKKLRSKHMKELEALVSKGEAAMIETMKRRLKN